MTRFDKANIEDIYPMSDIQKGMLFHSYVDESNTTYHDQNLFEFMDGSFDLALFQRAVDLLVEKHAMLRTTFSVVEFSEPVQIVYRQIVPDITFHDFSGMPTYRAQLGAIGALLEADRQQPFLPDQFGLFWRMKLIRISEEKMCLLWLFHHALFDGWSTSSFITELHNVYQQLKSDPGYRVPGLGSTYRTYIVEQLLMKENEEVKQFWKAELDGYKRLDLRSVAGGDGAERIERYGETLGDELFAQLTKTADAFGFPIKTVCFAAYLYTLKLFSYDNDLVVGLVGNNRPVCEDSDKILGCFLNTVPFRIQVPGATTWLEFIRLVSRKQEELAGYDQLSFFEIVRLLKEDVKDQNPFFDTTFNYVDFHVFNRMEGYESFDQTQLGELFFEKTNTFLDLDVSTTLNQFTYEFVYLVPYVAPATARRLAGYFKNILRAMAGGIEKPVRHEDILPAGETQQLLHAFNGNCMPLDPSVSYVDAFEEQAAQSPDRVAATDAARVTYRELNERANQVAHWLLEAGVGEEEVVALYFGRNVFLLAALLGVLKTRASFVAIDTDFPDERAAYIIGNTRTRFVLTQEHLAGRLASLPVGETPPQYVAVEAGGAVHPALAPYPSHNPGLSIDPQRLAYLIYTSGTTGVPKGVMIHHLGLMNHFAGVAAYLQLAAGDRMAQTASCSFDVSVMQFLLCLLSGGAICIFDKEIQLDPARFVSALNDRQVTLLELVPAHIHSLLESVESQPVALPHLRYLLSTGDALPGPLAGRWLRRFPGVPLVNAYGPAETSDDVTFATLAAGPVPHPVPVGKPLPNIQVHVLDQGLRLCPSGATGEICISGVAVGKGYWGDPAGTARAFVANPLAKHYPGRTDCGVLYRTGDLGYWREDGALVTVGRCSQMVKIRGNRVDLGEVEQVLLQREEIRQVAVIDKPVGDDKALCAYYVSDHPVPATELNDFLRRRLPPYMVPAYFTRVDHIPLSPNGKVVRQALPDPAPASGNATYVAPGNDAERIITQVWKEVLGLDRVGVHDNFFDIGGHSLNLIKVNEQLKKQLERDIPVVALFQYPTVRALAGFLTGRPADLLTEVSMTDSVHAMDNALQFFLNE